MCRSEHLIITPGFELLCELPLELPVLPGNDGRSSLGQVAGPIVTDCKRSGACLRSRSQREEGGGRPAFGLGDGIDKGCFCFLHERVANDIKGYKGLCGCGIACAGIVRRRLGKTDVQVAGPRPWIPLVATLVWILFSTPMMSRWAMAA